MTPTTPPRGLRLRVVAALAALAAAGTPAGAATVRCDARCLDAVMARTLAAIPTGSVAGLPIAPAAIIRENAHPVGFGEGGWRRITAIKAVQVFADPVTENVWAYAAAQLRDGPLAQLSIRLRLAGGRIVEVETLINTGARNPGSPYPGGPYDAENILEQDVLYLAPVAPARRSTRADLIRIADGYFEAIGRHDPAAASFGSRCERYESGARGTNQLRRNADQAAAQGSWSGTCGSSLVNLTGQQTVERRFPVVDVEHGVVIGYMFIPHHERTPPADNFINEMFKIVDGKIRQVDAVGFNLPAPATSGFR